jgi:Tfp pilus assembly protein PilF
MDHDMSKQDSMARLFSAERLVRIFLFFVPLTVYLAAMNWAPAPGLPTQALLVHLGLGASPGVLDPLWGWLVRLFARLPGLSVAGWMGLFSALCGAACVSLLGCLMLRVRYQTEMNPAQTQVVREIQARRISGLTAGLYLAFCIPFWTVSTRSLPGSFHLLGLLLAAWTFSGYQRDGRLRHLGLLGVLYGAGIAEFATFIVFLPFAGLLVAREMVRQKTAFDWRSHLVLWGGGALGLSLYPVHAYALFRQGAAAGLFASPWQAWAQILREQVLLIAQAPYRNPVFLFIMFFSIAMWLVVFAMSHRSPWFYEGDQVVMRLIFAGSLLFVLLVVRFVWRKLGLDNLMMTPHLLLAACMGYLAGEFWILGEHQALADDSRAKQFARRGASLFAWLLPLGVLASGIQNWRVVDGRYSRIVESAAMEVLDRLEGRDIVFSNGLLDDALNLAVWDRGTPVRVVSASRAQSGPYLRLLALRFPEKDLQVPLRQGEFGQFLDNLLLSDAGLSRTAMIDMPEAFREFGYLEPDGFLYRFGSSADGVHLPALIESQRAFWFWMEQMAAHPVPEANLIRPYQDLLRLLVSKVVNNLGVMQAEQGDETGALETFRTARRIYPENLSVLLNLLELAQGRELPEQETLETDWQIRQDKLGGEKWVLAIRYGYVWNAREWVRRGWRWALSGAPTVAEAARRNPSATEQAAAARAQLLDQAYLLWGSPSRDENACRAMLMRNEKDASALMALCQLALRRNDPEVAEAYLAAALELGLQEKEVRFDQAMTIYVRGDREKAVAALEELTRRQTPVDARVWMALLLLTSDQDPMNVRALKSLETLSAPPIGVRLALAWMHLSRRQWSEAQAELDQAVQMDSKNKQAWEMLVTLSQIRGDRKLREASLRTLLALDPQHPFRLVQEANELYRRGAWAEAEAKLSPALCRHRNPDLLNAMANLILARNGDLHYARALVDEAIQKQPFNPMFHGTRGELELKEGRFDEAEQDLHQAFEVMPNHVQLLLLMARLHAARGEKPAALDLARSLVLRQRELSPAQQAQLEKLLEQDAGHE